MKKIKFNREQVEIVADIYNLPVVNSLTMMNRLINGHLEDKVNDTLLQCPWLTEEEILEEELQYIESFVPVY